MHLIIEIIDYNTVPLYIQYTLLILIASVGNDNNTILILVVA